VGSHYANGTTVFTELSNDADDFLLNITNGPSKSDY
jgi:hypothetical protein